jgi:hypothetical protein
MRLIIVLAVLICAAGYLGLAPEATFIADIPFPLLAGSAVTLAMLYVFAKA